MNAIVKWIDGMAMQGQASSGHTIIMDGPEDLGGKNLGTRPMEMLLLGMGACTMVDVISILQKMRQSITACQVQINSKRSTDIPYVFTDISMNFIIKGVAVNSSKVQKAISLSAAKYCSASIMLGKTANITHTFELID